jgi:hypothetical protein
MVIIRVKIEAKVLKRSHAHAITSFIAINHKWSKSTAGL